MADKHRPGDVVLHRSNPALRLTVACVDEGRADGCPYCCRAVLDTGAVFTFWFGGDEIEAAEARAK